MISKHRLLSIDLFRDLNPKDWPISISDLPSGSALVGGSVRDGLLNKLSQKPDLDFVLPINAIQFTKKLSTKVNGTFIKLDENRDIARFAVNGWTLDFARQVGRNLKDDLLRRDFRINAIALKLERNPQIYDPTGGLDDLQSKQIVAITEKNLIDDPLRILRGFRLMCELDFVLEEKTKSLIRKNSNRLKKVAPERIKTEILKIIHSEWGESVWPTYLELQLLNNWQDDQIPSMKDLIKQTYVDTCSDELLISRSFARLICLLSDEGLSKLTFNRNQIKFCQKLRYWVCKINKCSIENLSEDERFQLHIDLGQHLRSFMFFLNENSIDEWLSRWKDPCDPLFHPSSPVDGVTLQKIFKIPPGPSLGALMRYLSKEKAFGRIFTKKEAFEVARNWTLENSPFL